MCVYIYIDDVKIHAHRSQILNYLDRNMSGPDWGHWPLGGTNLTRRTVLDGSSEP